MLSFASSCCSRRAGGSSALIASSKRSLSTAAAAAPPRVISRRVWQVHKGTLPKTRRPKPKSVDDKPWPRSVQLAGFAAGIIFVPYSCVWLITSSPSLRPLFGKYLEPFRTHFGEAEWDAKGYVEQEELEDGYYQFPEEWSYTERTLEEAMQARDSGEVTANLYVLGGDELLQQTKHVPATTRANRQVLSELVGGIMEATTAVVAVDFEPDNDITTTTTSTTATASATDSTTLMKEQPHTTPKKTLPLLQQTHTFSNWYYHHHYPAQQSSQPSSMTDVEVEESRLEYTITELEQQLKDPNGTRDIDDMASELRQAKRDLSKLKWKRRLGL